MLTNYLKIAFRNLTRNLQYVVINVLGLGIALGFGILAFINYRYSTSYDNWHTNRDRIVRIETIQAENDVLYGYCPSQLATEAQQQLAGVEAAIRFDSQRAILKQGENIFNETVHFADTNFLHVFDFKLLNGSADFTDPSSVLISKEAATKYFGKQNPIGQTLTLYADQTFKKPLIVKGIIDGQIKHSSIRFHLLTRLDNQLDQGKPVDYSSWKWQIDAVFLLLKSPADILPLRALLEPLVARQQSADPYWKVKRFIVEPLRTLALHGRESRSNALYPTLPPSAIWGTLIMAILLLLTAALNFANMTIATCNRRLREMGIRKVMGSSQSQLVIQLLTESGVICGFAILLGMILAYPITGWYNQMWQYIELWVDYTDPALLAYLIGLLLFTTLLAGSYPAFYVSAFRPAHIFRGTTRFGGSGLFSRIMMGMQVAISLTSVVMGISFERNAEYNRTAEIGYDRHHLIDAFVYDESSWRIFQEAARNIPAVEQVGGAQQLPGFNARMSTFKLNSHPHEAIIYSVGDDFTNLFQIRLLEGRPLLPKQNDVPSQAVLVNETFVREFGNGKPLINQTIQIDSLTYQISGVVRDFLTTTPFRPISAAVIRPVSSKQFSYFVARVKAGHQKQVFTELEKTWKRLFPYKPFDGFYQNQALAEAEEVSITVAQTMSVFAVATILLTISGLFSLISLNVVKRMREIAIRRVLGATGAEIGWVLHKSYVWILALSIVAGCAGGHFLGLQLMNSIFKINNGIPVSAFLLASFGILLIALTTILLKLRQTLQLNPIDSLKSD